MMKQRIVLCFISSLFYTAYASDIKKQSVQKLTAERVFNGVLARIGTMLIPETFQYIDEQYAEKHDDKKQLVPKSGVDRLLGVTCKTDTEEQKKRADYIKNKQTYILFCSLPWCAQETILNYMGLENKEVIDKVIIIPIVRLFEIYAEREDESLQQLKQVPLQKRFLCSKEQLDCVRNLVLHSLLQPSDPQKYCDREKGLYIPNLYELTQKEKQLIITLPQLFVQAANCCDTDTILVSQKQNPIKQGCKTALALALNQGRYRILQNGLQNNIVAIKLVANATLRLASLCGPYLYFNSIISPNAFCGIGGFLIVGPCGEMILDQPITNCFNRISSIKVTSAIFGIVSILTCICGKSLKNLFIPWKSDGIIIGSLFATGMTWDYYKYGVTYDCRSKTIKEFWEDAQQKKASSKNSICTLL